MDPFQEKLFSPSTHSSSTNRHQLPTTPPPGELSSALKVNVSISTQTHSAPQSQPVSSSQPHKGPALTEGRCGSEECTSGNTQRQYKTSENLPKTAPISKDKWKRYHWAEEARTDSAEDFPPPAKAWNWERIGSKNIKVFGRHFLSGELLDDFHFLLLCFLFLEAKKLQLNN